MRRILQIEDHTGFHLAIARAVLAGGALALLGALVPLPSWLSGLLAIVLLGAAMAPPRELRQGAWLLVCGVLGGGVTALLGPGTWAGALCLGLCLGLGIAHGDMPRWQRLLTVASGALLSWGGALIPGAVAAQDALQGLPGEIGTLLGGMGLGLVAGSAALTRQLRVRLDPVDRDLLQLLPPKGAEDEISKLVSQAMTTYQEAAEALGEEPLVQVRAAAEELVRKIARFGKRWRDIEEQARKSDKAALEGRLADLRGRQEAATDEQVRSEYERAQAAVKAQLDYLHEIDGGRERAVARLHHQVATLERLRLAVLRHHSVDAAKLGEELRTVVDDLTRAGQELDTASEALAEVP